MKTLDVIKRDILDKNFSEVEFPLLNFELVEAADSFLNFLAKTSNYIKNKINSAIDPNERNIAEPTTEIGYMRKKKKAFNDTNNDDKEVFHYHPYVEEVAKERDCLTTEVSQFFEHARPVYDAAVHTTKKIIEVLETKYPEIRFHFFPQNMPERFHLRFLKYDPKKSGENLGRAHYDRGTITLAIAESSPGLRIGVP